MSTPLAPTRHLSQPVFISCFTTPAHRYELPSTSKQSVHPVLHRPKKACIPPPQPPQTNLSLSTPSSTPITPPPDIVSQSLTLLEWRQLTAHVLRHAATTAGRATLAPTGLLHIPQTLSDTNVLLQQTRELHHIQYTLLRPLDFSGIRPHAAQAASQAAKGRILTGQQLVSISQTLNTARNIRRHIDGITTENPNLLDALPRLVSSFRTWPEVQSEIRRCIDEFGEVQETADGALRDLRGQMRATDSEIRKQLNAIMTRYSDAIQDRVITVRYDRFVIPVKMGRKGSFKSGVVHDASASGNTAYIEPASVRRMNDRRRQLAAMEKARVRAILKRLSEKVVAPIVQDVFNLEKVIGVLDAGVGRASFSKMLDCVDVVFDNDRPLRLRGVRHPLLSCKAMADTRKEEGLEECDWKTRVVASDYILPKDVRCVCITGPNTGGKTISLKALGISVLMAKAGMFVPASAEWNSAARIPYFDKVLADIGDDQSLVQSLSTFSGHVRRIKSILASSTGKSLVLLDEIGSGTDPSEGAALGMSILQHLAINKRALLTFATTHHGELKTLKYRGEESGGKYFENASVEFDDIEMRPTFRLIWGIAGNSNALTVAKRLGLDESVVRQAQDALAGGGGIRDEKGEMRDVHGLLEGIEKDRIAAETAARRTEEALRMAEEKVEMANEMLADAREMQRTGREKAEEQVEREVRKAREKINEVVRNMQKGGGSAKAAGVAQKELEGLFATEVGGDQVLVEDVRIGDWITVGRLGGGEAEVVGMVGQREVVVGIGGMRAKVGVREISKVRRGGSSRARGRGSTDGVVAASVEVRTGGGRGGGGKETMKTAGNTVDIRGERVDEGVRRVEKGIDRAVGGGGNAVWIVHGFGTGRLKKGVREYLSACDLVKDMYDAESTDGGAGVTVAVLK